MIRFQPAPARLPPRRRIYAVGDIHGQLERLAALHARIADDLAARPAEAPLLVHVGDYLDRGPDSAGVIARLLDPEALPPMPVVNLMGNHERMALDSLAGSDRRTAAHWLANGGAAALRSWGVPEGTPLRDWAARLPPAHLAFLRGLAQHHWEGEYLFVHAGIRPDLPLDRQSPHDLLWMREPFLSWPGPWNAGSGLVAVVHGHTPGPEPDVRSNRIGIDTGAGNGHKLTCAVIELDRLGFLSAE